MFNISNAEFVNFLLIKYFEKSLFLKNLIPFSKKINKSRTTYNGYHFIYFFELALILILSFYLS